MFLDNKEELEKFLMQDDIQEQMIAHDKEIGRQFPELGRCISFPQNNVSHHLDVYRHTALTLSFAPKSIDIRLALFFHDIGKPLCYQDEPNGIRHFKGHPEVSARLAKKILLDLGYDEKYVRKICLYIKNHDDIITKANIRNKIDLLGYKGVGQLIKMQECDARAHHPNKVEKRLVYLASIRKIYEHL